MKHLKRIALYTLFFALCFGAVRPVMVSHRHRPAGHKVVGTAPQPGCNGSDCVPDPEDSWLQGLYWWWVQNMSTW